MKPARVSRRQAFTTPVAGIDLHKPARSELGLKDNPTLDLGNTELQGDSALSNLCRGSLLLQGAGFGSEGGVPLWRMRAFLTVGQADQQLNTVHAEGRIQASPGAPLPEAVRIRLESAFGHDFSHVRIHTDAAANDACVDLHALAFTLGAEIYFGRGKFAPDTLSGMELLGHELTHVVQADEHRLPAVTGKGMQVSDPQSSSEREATRMGQWLAEAQGILETGESFDAFWGSLCDQNLGAGMESNESHQDQGPGAAAFGFVSRQDEEVRESAVIEGVQTLRHAFGEDDDGTDEATVLKVLNQSPALVKAIVSRYQALVGVPLVEDLARELDDSWSDSLDWDTAVVLLERAGVQVPSESTGSAKFPSPTESTTHSIRADPNAVSVVPGMEILYRVDFPDRIQPLGTRDVFEWFILPDPEAVASGRLPSRIEGPRTPTWSFEWTETGAHVVVCVTRSVSGTRTSEPIYVQREEYVRTLSQATAMGYAESQALDYERFRAALGQAQYQSIQGGLPDQSWGTPHIVNSGPNPAVPGAAPNYSTHTYTISPSESAKKFQWYVRCDTGSEMPTRSYYGYSRRTVDGLPAFDLGHGRTATWIIADIGVYEIICEEQDDSGRPLGTLARYVQVVQSEQQAEHNAALSAYVESVDRLVATLPPEKRLGLRAAYYNTETGRSVALALLAGVQDSGAVLVLDLTPGVERTTYSGADISEALTAFESGNDYPDGQIELSVPNNGLGLTPIQRIMVTNGTSPWDVWSKRTGWASLGLAGLGLLSLAIPGAQVAAPYFFATAMAMSTASSALSIVDQFAQGEVDTLRLSVDMLGVAGGILAGAAAFRTIASGASVMSRGTRMLIYTGLGLDGVSGVMLSVEGWAQIRSVLDGDMPEGQKAATIARILTNLAVSWGLLFYSVRHAWIPQGVSEDAWRNAGRHLRKGADGIDGEFLVHGSRASGNASARSDLDFAIRVDSATFDAQIGRCFGVPNSGSSKERTMLHAIEKGKIQAGEAKLSRIRADLEGILGMDVDVSIIRRGGPFDQGPYLPIPE